MMKRYLTPCLVVILFSSCESRSQNIPNQEGQIASAVQAIPEDQRQGASVYGYDDAGMLVQLRAGTNNMICMADDPDRDGINISCYHKDLEAFMARGRELRSEGLGGQDIFDQREKEVQEGTLKMPETASTLAILYGADDILNRETGEVTGGSLRYVVYIPYATGESTGLPLQPTFQGQPWLMDPGTHRAHIMITPPKVEQ